MARIKAKIVFDVLKLLEANPPKPNPTRGSNIEVANDLADAYIEFTDQFLKVHYGAKPSLGSRFEIFGWQNSINAPWCADWAEGLVGYLMEHFPANHPIHQRLRIQWGQMHGPEHNFVVIYPYGNPPQMPVGGNKILSKKVPNRSIINSNEISVI